MSKKSKKHNKKHHNSKSTNGKPSASLNANDICIRKFNQIIEIPHSYLIRGDISPLVSVCKKFEEYDPVDCNILAIFTDTPIYSSKSDIMENFTKPLIGYFFKLVSEYPQALMYLRHRKKNCTDDLTNAINILDFYSDYHRFAHGVISFEQVITKLCDYLKSKGKTLSEIFEIVINEVAYPIGVPVDVQKFEFNNIPDIKTLIAAILNIYKFCRDYMDMCTYSMNFENITVNYDKKTKVLSAVCK